jgi:hypothetical protein
MHLMNIFWQLFNFYYDVLCLWSMAKIFIFVRHNQKIKIFAMHHKHKS